MRDSGVFTLSLDTELAWGSFDKNGLDRYGSAYRQTPALVDRLCGLLAQYDVSATWALVAHLFSNCDGHNNEGADADAAEVARREWLAGAPCSTGVERSLWYNPALLETIRDCEVSQDVGLHGYSHLVFGEHSRVAADAELTDAMTAAREIDLDPTSFVFPRNDVAHVDVLADHGIEVYRGLDARWYEQRPLGRSRKPLRFLDEAAARTPPAVRPTERDGVVCLPGSQVFRPERGAWGLTPDGTQVSRARKGLDRAASTGDVYHLWLHPFNLADDVDRHLDVLEDILTYVDALRADDEIKTMSMTEVARAYRAGR